MNTKTALLVCWVALALAFATCSGASSLSEQQEHQKRLCASDDDPACDDGNICTIDTCDTTVGECHYEVQEPHVHKEDPCTVWECDPAVGAWTSVSACPAGFVCLPQVSEGFFCVRAGSPAATVASVPTASTPAASTPAGSTPAASVPAASIPVASIPAASTPVVSTPAASQASSPAVATSASTASATSTLEILESAPKEAEAPTSVPEVPTPATSIVTDSTQATSATPATHTSSIAPVEHVPEHASSDKPAAPEDAVSGQDKPSEPAAHSTIALCASDCSDGDACTLDSCVEGVGCLHVKYPDAEVSGVSGSCMVAQCVSATGEVRLVETNCDDGVPATEDSCVNGECVHLLTKRATTTTTTTATTDEQDIPPGRFTALGLILSVSILVVFFFALAVVLLVMILRKPAADHIL